MPFELVQEVAFAEPGHPAEQALDQAQLWVKRAREAARNGNDERARECAENAQICGRASRQLLADRNAEAAYPVVEEAGGQAQYWQRLPEGRAAKALGSAAGAHDAEVVGRGDGGQTVAWSGEGFAGAATVYPGDDNEGGHPHARVVLTDLDQDRYQALANSPWPYRTEDGAVIYDRLPADQAEQVLTAARTGEPAKPWQRHGLTAGRNRDELPEEDAAKLEDESARWSQSLSDDQEEYVTGYTGHDFYEVNKHLYEGKPREETVAGMTVPLREVTHHLDSAIARAARPAQPHITYRGYQPPMDVRRADGVLEWVHENFKVGGTYRDPSYISVSHCPEVAGGFSRNKWFSPATGEEGIASHGVVFEIVSSHGAAVASVSAFDNEERERLMPRNSAFHVVGIQDNVTIGRENKVVVQMVDVHDVPRH
ncbi:ADP-ribosyltransferase [Streptomyces sp. NPDC059835]|uniref:ADP-ribosyltransferase n=1 Tax=Streptomyces sp. NPDC059835 TaxID=3346967 RepID=UPI00365E70B4